MEKNTTVLLGNLSRDSGKQAKYSTGRLISLLEPKSTFSFPLYLNDAVKLGILNREISVLAPNKEHRVKSFKTLGEIPENLYDYVSGNYFDITPDLLEETFSFTDGVDAAGTPGHIQDGSE